MQVEDITTNLYKERGLALECDVGISIKMQTGDLFVSQKYMYALVLCNTTSNYLGLYMKAGNTALS